MVLYRLRDGRRLQKLTGHPVRMTGPAQQQQGVHCQPSLPGQWQ